MFYSPNKHREHGQLKVVGRWLASFSVQDIPLPPLSLLHNELDETTRRVLVMDMALCATYVLYLFLC